ncbi:hypothetical protein [Cupriavidus basilensis]|uniref:hypothetical protein n=1 Tax=Cupriavidus basilensis TaxID=68895 RepID=UPI0023E8856B|nr:hypothetical protein [Cupriavidus basilensis]MDF3881509.1 hypothetical protein [Cupriavidus basilensis]
MQILLAIAAIGLAIFPVFNACADDSFAICHTLHDFSQMPAVRNILKVACSTPCGGSTLARRDRRRLALSSEALVSAALHELFPDKKVARASVSVAS